MNVLMITVSYGRIVRKPSVTRFRDYRNSVIEIGERSLFSKSGRRVYRADSEKENTEKLKLHSWDLMENQF